MAPLRRDPAPAGVAGRRPLGEAILALGELRRHCRRALFDFLPSRRAEQLAACERVNVAREAVCRSEEVDRAAGELLLPQVLAPLGEEPIGRLAPYCCIFVSACAL